MCLLPKSSEEATSGADVFALCVAPVGDCISIPQQSALAPLVHVPLHYSPWKPFVLLCACKILPLDGRPCKPLNDRFAQN